MSNETSQAATIQFRHFVVRESHIQFTEPGEYKIKVDFDPKAFIFPELGHYQLGMGVSVEDEEGKFSIRLVTNSIFYFDPVLNLEELKDGYFVHNAPAIVFPYIRSYIAALTALSGMPALTLPTLNLSALGPLLKENTQIMPND